MALLWVGVATEACTFVAHDATPVLASVLLRNGGDQEEEEEDAEGGGAGKHGLSIELRCGEFWCTSTFLSTHHAIIIIIG